MLQSLSFLPIRQHPPVYPLFPYPSAGQLTPGLVFAGRILPFRESLLLLSGPDGFIKGPVDGKSFYGQAHGNKPDLYPAIPASSVPE